MKSSYYMYSLLDFAHSYVYHISNNTPGTTQRHITQPRLPKKQKMKNSTWLPLLLKNSAWLPLLLLLTTWHPVTGTTIDLSHELTPDSFVFANNPEYSQTHIRRGRYRGVGHFVSFGKLLMPEHAGTHMNAPSHWKEGEDWIRYT